MNTEILKNWEQINRLTKGKKLVFFGTGDWSEKARRYIRTEAAYEVDNNPYAQNEKNSVYHPDKLRDEAKDTIFIVITTTSIHDVTIQLIDMGFQPGIHFVVSYGLSDNVRIRSIIEECQELLVSNSDPFRPGSNFGGGLYILNLPSGELTKVKDGHSHGLVLSQNHYFWVEDTSGVKVLDFDLVERDVFKLPSDACPHGIAYSEARNQLFVSFSGKDSIGILCSRSGKLLKEVSFSDKFNKTGKAQHHINDLCIYNDRLFVSMFSRSGYWKMNVFDGVICEIDIDSGNIVGDVIANLLMPHTPCFIDGVLHYCDSLRGNLCNTNWRTLGSFNGFIRGVVSNGDYYFVAQSAHRYIDRILGTKQNISLDSGIYIFDSKLKLSKFTETKGINDINSIALYSKKAS